MRMLCRVVEIELESDGSAALLHDHEHLMKNSDLECTGFYRGPISQPIRWRENVSVQDCCQENYIVLLLVFGDRDYQRRFGWQLSAMQVSPFASFMDQKLNESASRKLCWQWKCPSRGYEGMILVWMRRDDDAFDDE